MITGTKTEAGNLVDRALTLTLAAADASRCA
jgi:hypothetical protein